MGAAVLEISPSIAASPAEGPSSPNITRCTARGGMAHQATSWNPGRSWPAAADWPSALLWSCKSPSTTHLIVLPRQQLINKGLLPNRCCATALSRKGEPQSSSNHEHHTHGDVPQKLSEGYCATTSCDRLRSPGEPSRIGLAPSIVPIICPNRGSSGQRPSSRRATFSPRRHRRPRRHPGGPRPRLHQPRLSRPPPDHPHPEHQPRAGGRPSGHPGPWHRSARRRHPGHDR